MLIVKCNKKEKSEPIPKFLEYKIVKTYGLERERELQFNKMILK